MAEVGWLTRALADVPRHDRWLSEREHGVLSTLVVPKRRADWRLGRWAAKAAVAAWQGAAADAVEVAAAEDGAPEVLIEGETAQLAVSISHRAGRALAAVGDAPSAIGCDLEALEPRSQAFVREWFGPDERALVRSMVGERQDLAANLLWTAKEAAAKARRAGLRLNIRQATVRPSGLAHSRGSWQCLRVAWDDGRAQLGWWRGDPGWVMAVVSEPASDEPPSELC